MSTENKYYIIWHKQGEDDGIVLDGFKCAYKGTKEEMSAIYRELYQKALKLIDMGQAKDFKEFYDEDLTLWFRFTRNGNIIKTFLCDKKRAAILVA